VINIDYGAVKGFTVSFEKRFSDGFSANLDYTFQIAKGDASDPNEALIMHKPILQLKTTTIGSS